MRKAATCALLALGGWLSVRPASAQAATAPGDPAGPPPQAVSSGAVPGGAGAPELDLAFWRALGDPALDHLLTEMLAANLDVRAATARLVAARAARREAQLELAPTGSVSGAYTRQRLSPYSFPNGSGTFPDQDIWDVGFDASWEIDVFGRLRRGLAARQAEVEASSASLRDVQVSLSAELARAYFDLRGAQEQLAVARRNTENQRRTLDLTRQRLDAGRGTAFDAERASAQLSFTLATVPALEAREAAARYRVAVLAGRQPGAESPDLQAAGELPTPPPELVIDDADALVRRRPDVVAAERQLAAARAFAGAAAAETRPTLSLGGSAGYTARTLGGFGERGTFRYVLGSTLSWPAFGLGRLRAGVAIARAHEQEASDAYEQAVLRAREELEATAARYRAATARVAQIRNAASSGAHAAELARLRFSDGLGDLLDVLDAERTQLEAEDLLAQARTEAATAYAALFKALGGATPAASRPAGS